MSFLKKISLLIIVILLFNNFVFSQETLILEDNLQGSTQVGTKVGGTFTSEGYKPGTGENHILYSVPQQIWNGYVEVEVKGFNYNNFIDSVSTNTSFFVMYDGRGIPEPIKWWKDYRSNYFRWEIVYRSDRYVNEYNYGNRFKGKMHTAAETPERLNSTYAVFPYVTGTVTDNDWSIEPNGLRKTWNQNQWYTIRTEWNNDTKDFRIYRDGVEVWHNKKNIGQPYEGDEHFSSTSPYPWLPVDFKIWLGSGPSDAYDNKMPDMVFRNFKVVAQGVYIPDTLDVSPTNVSVSSSSGSTNIDVVSNIDWETTTNESWITLLPSSGSGDGVISASYEANPSNDERTGIIEISANNLTDTITIVQNGKPVIYINISPENANVGFISGQVNFFVEANVNWSVSSSNDWVFVFRQDTTEHDTLFVTYSQNNSSNSRTAEIVVSNDSISSSCFISQGGSNAYINISKRSWEVSKNSGSVSFYIESNLAWSLTSKASWLTTSFSDSSGNASFMVNYNTNTDTSARTGIILIESDFITDSVSVIQSGADPMGVELVVNPVEAGTVSGSGIYGYGSYATLKAIANEGWQFNNWTENDSIVSVDTVWTFEIKTNRSFTANFNSITDVNEHIGIPEKFEIYQNYPNPFNPSTTIKFGLPSSSDVVIKLYNLLGQELLTLVDNNYSAGTYSIKFDASELTSGIYIYTINAKGGSENNFVQSKKMILLK